MPALFTHQLIAEHAMQQLSKAIQQKVENKAIYYLGAQGADLFFFYRLHAGKKNNLGGKLHKLNIYQTFSALQRHLWRLQNQYADYMHAMQTDKSQQCAMQQNAEHILQEITIFQAYIAGYITHYVADTVFHPFIYAMEEKFLKMQPKWRGKRHVYIENDVDSYLLERYKGVKPAEYKLNFTIDDFDLPALCSTLRVLCYEAGYPNFTMQQLRQILKRINLFSSLTRDKRQFRRFFLHGLEKALFIPHIFSVTMHRNTVDELCINSQHNVWINPSCKDKISTESASDLFERAIAESVVVLTTFFECVDANKPLPKEIFNKHFLSGLDESIPHIQPSKNKKGD